MSDGLILIGFGMIMWIFGYVVGNQERKLKRRMVEDQYHVPHCFGGGGVLMPHKQAENGCLSCKVMGMCVKRTEERRIKP